MEFVFVGYGSVVRPCTSTSVPICVLFLGSDRTSTENRCMQDVIDHVETIAL